jgi:hypothetical protein
MKNIEEIELMLITSMLKDIAGTNDPVEQYRAIERYAKFIEARAVRIESDAAGSRKAKG